MAHGGTGQTTLAALRNSMGLGNSTGTLAIANGGTGATTAAGIRNAIGLGNTTGAVPIANGGTGATTAAGAKTNLGFATMASYTGTLNTTWSGSNPYSQAITITGIVATDAPVIDLTLSGTLNTDNDRIKSWGFIQRAVTAANKITFYAYGTKPSVSLPFHVMCVR